jgi:hypothetical protein
LLGLSAVTALFALAQTASADDVIRLKSSPNLNATTVTLGTTNADIELARHGGYGGGYRGGYGGYRGGYGGYHGGYRGGYYGGYRGGYYGGYRGYAGYRGYYGGYYRPYYTNYYRPYYGGYYTNYYPYYGGYGYGNYGYGGYGYGSGLGYGGYYGCSTISYPVVSQYAYSQPYYPSVTPYGTTPVQPYNSAPIYNGINGYNEQPPMPPVTGDGTYPYNGGPNQLVPMPQQQPQQQQQINPAGSSPRNPVADLRLVSTSSQTVQPATQYTYPAYGEDNRASGFAINRTAPKSKR